MNRSYDAANESDFRASERIIRELSAAVLRWYPFVNGSKVFYGGEDGTIIEMLQEMGVIWSDSKRQKEYDYVIAIGELESSDSAKESLLIWISLLKEDGILLLGTENRLGIRWFCGDTDPYTGKLFSGIENYLEDSTTQGRMYDKAQLCAMLEGIGVFNRHCYSVFPHIQVASMLIRDDYRPKEALDGRLFPEYSTPDTVFIKEERLYQGMVDNDLLHSMANGFLFECTVAGVLCDIRQVTISIDRGRQNACVTYVHDDHSVTKAAVYPQGQSHIREIVDNHRRLSRRGVPVVEMIPEGEGVRMPFLEGESAQAFFQRLCVSDREGYLQALDTFCEIIRQASDYVEGNWEGIPAHIADYAYPDMVAVNALVCDEEFVFFDQEISKEHYPLEAVLYRAVCYSYAWGQEAGQTISIEELLERYGLKEHEEVWNRLSREFLDELRGDRRLEQHHMRTRRIDTVTDENRRWMVFSKQRYYDAVLHCFDQADTRRIVLFGSGRWASHFLSRYGDDYDIIYAVDNDESRYGEYLYRQGEDESIRLGIEIKNPSVLSSLQHGTFKVIVCIKDYREVIRQLERMGIYEYGIYVPAIPYERRRSPVVALRGDGRKAFYRGYIAGVFDLFHIGHLNLFRRAKEQCEYLIVGVVSDEGVLRFKGVEPVVPFAERIEMVRACRYVDEAVEIPLIDRGTEEAWEMHHFDVQFSGSDYVDSPLWQHNKAFLESHGATLIFFPYTESTSSTKLKQMIRKKLL